MSKQKIFDCITFYNENVLVNSRFEILNSVVDYLTKKFSITLNEKVD